jgi:hypothetical protein
MIEIEYAPTTAFVTFELESDHAVSVVGSFNGWNPLAHPMEPNTRGFRGVTVELNPGRYEFRYLAEGGAFFDDDEFDVMVIEDNGMGGTHGVLDIELLGALA